MELTNPIDSAVSCISEGIIVGFNGFTSSVVSSWFLNTGNDIIDSEEHASRLNSGIERLEFDGAWIPNRGGVHVFYLSGVSVNSHVESLFILMEGSKLGKHSNDVSTTVLG